MGSRPPQIHLSALSPQEYEHYSPVVAEFSKSLQDSNCDPREAWNWLQARLGDKIKADRDSEDYTYSPIASSSTPTTGALLQLGTTLPCAFEGFSTASVVLPSPESAIPARSKLIPSRPPPPPAHPRRRTSSQPSSVPPDVPPRRSSSGVATRRGSVVHLDPFASSPAHSADAAAEHSVRDEELVDWEHRGGKRRVDLLRDCRRR
ncbi:hypothetical protein JCM11491_001654 [Sporobolomyces phaffii]